MRIPNAQLAKEKVKLLCSQSLCKDVYKLHRSMNIFGLNFTILDRITNKVAVYFNMLCSFMKNWTSSYMQSRLTVTMQKHKSRMHHTKSRQQAFQPFQLTSDGCHGPIFRLSRRPRLYLLLLGLPRDWRRA